MQWEQLTATDFANAVHETGVCILPLGVLEKHSEHLPLGTDYLIGHRVACLAAEREPAVVFPPFYFGQIYEARCFPGTFTVAPGLLLELLQSVLDEIGRNGFKKIILFNAHGGNTHFLRFLAQSQLWEQKPYTLYMPTQWLSPEAEKQWVAMRSTDYGGHACEEETSLVLGIHPELVKMDRVPEQPGAPPGTDGFAAPHLHRRLVVCRLPRSLRWRCPLSNPRKRSIPDQCHGRQPGRIHRRRQGRHSCACPGRGIFQALKRTEN